jgi:hypothetical protein
MSEIDDLPPPPEHPISAADMRRRMAELELAKMEEAEAERRKLEAEHSAQVKAFLEGHIEETDVERLRARAAAAIEQGHTEVEVLRFPAELLADRGRAINNFDADWPETLRGKAAGFYQLYKARAEPLGYKLHARILTYPGGKPGEVGLFLSWA